MPPFYIRNIFPKIYNFIKAVGQIIILLGGLSAMYVGWETLNLANSSFNVSKDTSRMNILLSENKIAAENFQNALLNLTSENLSMRIGAITVLQDVARTNPIKYYWPVVHNLTAYIRTRCNKRVIKTPCSDDDLQEIISFLGEGERDVPHKMSDRIDLSNINLRGIEFNGWKASFVKFNGDIMDDVQFVSVDLRNSDFNDTEIKNSTFSNSDLSYTSFTNSILNNVEFFFTNLTSTNFAAVKNTFKIQPISMQFFDSNMQNVDFCNEYIKTLQNIITKCSVGFTCNTFSEARLYDSTLLPHDLTNCKFKIYLDPDRMKMRKAIQDYQTSHDLKKLLLHLPADMVGRLIYPYSSR